MLVPCEIDGLLMKQFKMLALLVFGFVLFGCTSELLRAPDLDDNKLYSQCSQGLIDLYEQVSESREAIPYSVRQRMISLLVSAEIDSQFRHFPFCVDKLERVRLYLKQVKQTAAS